MLESVQIFVTKWFARFARREEISDESLLEAIERAERGSIDADLGGGLIKQRIARPGKGKSGGYRTIIAYRVGKRAVFIFGFARNDRENLSDAELDVGSKLAAKWLGAAPATLARAIQHGEVKEVAR